VSHSYQTYFGFPGSDLNLDCRLRDHKVRIKKTGMHWDYITHNLIRILPNSKHNQYLLSNFHFTTFIQPLQSIRPRMLNTTQIQFIHKSITRYISTTTSIDYHATYLVLNVTSSVKYIFPLLIYIIFFDLHV
jgi:predicted P-loop ATPase